MSAWAVSHSNEPEDLLAATSDCKLRQPFPGRWKHFGYGQKLKTGRFAVVIDNKRAK
jgi:hypothetical protein